MDDKQNYDKSRYSKDRYTKMRRERDGGADSGSNVYEPKGSQVYSRKNASERYGQMQRHASGGADGLKDAAGGLKDAAGGFAARVADAAGSGVGGARARGVVTPKRIAAVIVAVVLIASVAWFAVVSNNMKPSEDVSGSVKAEGLGQAYYVLLMGSDKRAGEKGTARADSIMLARVDESKKQVTLVSLPRDLMVDIPGHGASKLNSALTYGGFSGAIDAASKVAGVDISYYAVIYFSGFKKLVDDLGGVTVEVPKGTYYKGTWVPAGKHSRINGKQALVLARCRHGNPPDQGAYAAGDFQRTKNQRNLMKAIVKEALGKNPVMLPGTIASISECVETNMPAHKMAFLGMAMKGMDADKMYTAVVPCTSQYINGVSWQVLDEANWKAMMKRVEAGKDPNG